MADVFDQLLALVHPDRVLRDPKARGAGIRVAVLDSGVDLAQITARRAEAGLPPPRIEGGIFRPDRAEPRPYAGQQSAPHGTTVADIILSLAPDVSLFSADVFGPQAGCEVETVIRALNWAMDVWKCQVINLSLGVPEARLQPVQRRYALQRAIEEAYYRDVHVFAAAHNEHPLTRSYPAVFAPPLISVDKGTFDDPFRFAYALREQIEFQAFARGYLGPFAQEPATSWATPHLAALAARILSLRPTLKPFEMKALLYWMFLAAERDPGAPPVNPG